MSDLLTCSLVSTWPQRHAFDWSKTEGEYHVNQKSQHNDNETIKCSLERLFCSAGTFLEFYQLFWVFQWFVVQIGASQLLRFLLSWRKSILDRICIFQYCDVMLMKVSKLWGSRNIYRKSDSTKHKRQKVNKIRLLPSDSTIDTLLALYIFSYSKVEERY